MRRWQKSTYRNINFINKVISDAISHKKLLIKGGTYYSCAKFIRDKYGYKFNKSPSLMTTCCNAYPYICGGKCCSRDEELLCGCSELPLDKKFKHNGNCYNDCCNIITFIKSRQEFYLQWV